MSCRPHPKSGLADEGFIGKKKKKKSLRIPPCLSGWIFFPSLCSTFAKSRKQKIHSIEICSKKKLSQTSSTTFIGSISFSYRLLTFLTIDCSIIWKLEINVNKSPQMLLLFHHSISRACENRNKIQRREMRPQTLPLTFKRRQHNNRCTW